MSPLSEEDTEAEALGRTGLKWPLPHASHTHCGSVYARQDGKACSPPRLYLCEFSHPLYPLYRMSLLVPDCPEHLAQRLWPLHSVANRSEDSIQWDREMITNIPEDSRL
jgi:hypothetical protein